MVRGLQGNLRNANTHEAQTREVAPGQAEAQTSVDSKLESVISVVNTSELSNQYQYLTRVNMVSFWMLSLFACNQNNLEGSVI